MSTDDSIGLFFFIFIIVIIVILIGILMFMPLFSTPNLCHSNSDCRGNKTFCRGNNLCSATAGVGAGALCTTNEDCILGLICLGSEGATTCGVLT